nr:DUF6379 domain-containing protein [Pseudomonas asiatica]
MFDNYLVRADSLKNQTQNGEVVGFSIAVRNANYRGVYLSLHNGYYIEVDGVEYPVSEQTFEINGKPPGASLRRAWPCMSTGTMTTRPFCISPPLVVSHRVFMFYAFSSLYWPPMAICPLTKNG